MIPSHIFREYDIRGVADTELTDAAVRDIARAFATVLIRQGRLKISVGRDLRPSSERMAKALIEGLSSSGLHVLDLGLVPTPLLYFSVAHGRQDGGIAITGSHNPPEYNGLKFHLADRPFYGEQLRTLRRMVEQRDFVAGEGRVEKSEIIKKYKEEVRRRLRFRRKFKVALDCGHGMGGLVAPDLLREFGHEVVELYCNLDPAFPDHHPDPAVVENLRDLQKKVVESRADIGIAFDGDADRIGIVDEKGNVILGDRVLLIYARAVLKERPGATILGDVKCSKIVYEDIAKRGGRPLMWKTGHSLLKAKMKEVGAQFAGEMSGHMFFAHRWYGFDDAIYAACRMLEILDQTSEPLSRLLSDLPPLATTPEIRVACPDSVKFDLVRRAVESFRKKYRVVDIDGARIEFEDGWGLVRASNTQPVLVMRFEAVNEKRLNEIRKLIEDEIAAVRART